MSAVIKLPKSGESVHRLAAQCLKTAKGDIGKAAFAMEQKVIGDQRLFRDLMSPLVASACREALSSIVRAERGAVWNARPTPQNEHRIVAAELTLLDMRLSTGVKLGDATAEDLRSEASFYDKQAKDMTWKSAFYSAVAAKVGAKKVRQALTVSQLEKIQEQTR